MHTLIIALLVTSRAYSQTVLCEVEVASNRIDYIQAFRSGDRTFLSFAEKTVKRNYWISENGTLTALQIDIPHDAVFAGIVRDAGMTYYLYFLQVGENLILSAMEQVDGQSTIMRSTPIFPISGEVLGVHTNQSKSTVVSYTRKPNRVRILSLKGLAIEHDRYFDIPFNFHAHRKSIAGFMTEQETATVEKGGKNLKLYAEPSKVVMSIDDDQPGNKNSKTTVIKFHVDTGEHEVFEFRRNDYHKFASFYHQDRLHQLVASDKMFEYYVYDLKSQKVLFQTDIKKEKGLRDHKVIINRGKSVEVGYSNLYEMITITDTAPSILVQPTADPAKLRIVIGSIYDYNESGDGAFIFLPIPILALAATATSLAVSNTHFNTRYITTIGNIESTFKIEDLEENTTPPMRQVIDEYEISRTSGTPKGVKPWNLLYKHYLESDENIFGIYHDKSKKMTVVRFEKSTISKP